MAKSTVEEYAKYVAWRKRFKSKFGRLYIDAKDGKAWFKTVNHNHKVLRELLGGISVRHTFDARYKKVVKSSQYGPVTRRIFRILPGYRELYELAPKDLMGSSIPLKNGSPVKTGKHIRHYGEKVLKINRDKMADLDYNIERLSRIRAQETNSNDKLSVTLTTEASSFVKLGHYRPDRMYNSCFAHHWVDSACEIDSSDAVRHKYIIGATTNTYVLLFRKDGKTVGRAWGWCDKDLEVFNVCNVYTEGTSCTNIQIVLRKLFATILDCKEVVIAYDWLLPEEGGPRVYINGVSKWSFYDKRYTRDYGCSPGPQVIHFRRTNTALAVVKK